MTRRDRQEFNDMRVELARVQAQLTITRSMLDRATDELAALKIEAREERHALLERIQRPDQEPVPLIVGDTVSRKLHYSEDDELAGLTVDEVAADAGITVAHRYAIAHVDELARSEGIE